MARVAATSCQIRIRPVESPAATFAPSGLIATQVIDFVWCNARGGDAPNVSGDQTRTVCRSWVANKLQLADVERALGFESLIRYSLAALLERSYERARPAWASRQEQVRKAVVPTTAILSTGSLIMSQD